METKISETDKPINNQQALNENSPVSSISLSPTRFRNVKRFLFIMFLIAVLAVAVLFYYFRKPAAENNNSSKQQSTTVIQQSKVVSAPTIENNRAMLLAKSKVDFPEILERKEIANTVLPILWQRLLGDSLEVAKAEELSYKNGQRGYLVTYPAPANVQTYPLQITQYLFSSETSAEILNSRYSSYFAIVEFEQGNEKFQLTQTADKQEENSSSKVIIQSIYEDQ